MLNFTNPMSAITGAMARHSSIVTTGLCHSADEMFTYFAKVFGAARPTCGWRSAASTTSRSSRSC